MARYYYNNHNQQQPIQPNPTQILTHNQQNVENINNYDLDIHIQEQPQLPQQIIIEDKNAQLRSNDQQAIIKMYKQIKKHNVQLFDDYHPYGYVFFNNKVLNKLNIHLFGYITQATLLTSQWDIAINKVEDVYLWFQRLKLIKQSQHRVLNIEIKSFINYRRIIKDIQPILFSDLITLNLYSCGFKNIENLSYLNCPKLQYLNLIYNDVYEYKSLHKSPFKLKSLYIYSKNIKTHKNYKLPYIKLNEYSRWDYDLRDLRLDKHAYNSVIMNDLSFIAKSNYNNGRIQKIKVSICRSSRIIKKNIIQKFNSQLITQIQNYQYQQE